MRKKSLANLAAAAAIAVSLTVSVQPASAAAHKGTFYGTVEHVSANNLKVRDPRTGQTLSFLIAPKFKNVFTKEGKHATQQMAFLHEGMPVEVIYEQRALDVRPAEKVIELQRLPRH